MSLCSRPNQIYAVAAKPSLRFILYLLGKGVLPCIVVLTLSFKLWTKKKKKIRCYELLFAVQTSDTFFEDIWRLLLTRHKLVFPCTFF
jgi:hypothetical protein